MYDLLVSKQRGISTDSSTLPPTIRIQKKYQPKTAHRSTFGRFAIKEHFLPHPLRNGHGR